MNVSDTELVETLLKKQGHQKVINPDEADILFVNTCSIREHACSLIEQVLTNSISASSGLITF